MSLFFRDHDERGAALSLATAMITPALFLCIGLVVDGSRKTEAARVATSAAAGASRAGINAETTSAIAGNPDPAVAYQAASQYLTSSGVPGTVSIAWNTITVTTTSTTSTVLLSLIGINSLTAHGQASATLKDVPA